MRMLSCGLLIESPSGWLLAHATGTDRWDLPKGRIEPGETPLQAALRECLEETGLDFGPAHTLFEDLGRHAYLSHKDLHLFRLRLPRTVDLSDCRCTTYAIRRDGSRVMETDDYAWVPPECVATHVGKSLVAYLQALDLLPQTIIASRPSMSLSR